MKAETHAPTDDRWMVEVVEYESDVVAKRIGPMSHRAAAKVENGVSINLNHELFFTRLARLAPDDPWPFKEPKRVGRGTLRGIQSPR